MMGERPLKSAELMPDARLHVIRGARHLPFFHGPEEFVQVVGAFLREGRAGF